MATNHAQIERAALCDLMDELGPDAPTLCEGWTTRDLAAHLVVREGRPDAALGILGGPLSSWGEKVRKQTAQRDFAALVRAVRSGPPWYSVMHPGPIDRAANTLEYFVHHEDVRRKVTGWEPRTLSRGLEEELFKILGRMAKILVRRAPAGVVLHAIGRDPITAKTAEPMVTVTGEVGELILFVEGRQAATLVELDGPKASTHALRSASFGI